MELTELLESREIQGLWGKNRTRETCHHDLEFPTTQLQDQVANYGSFKPKVSESLGRLAKANGLAKEKEKNALKRTTEKKQVRPQKYNIICGCAAQPGGGSFEKKKTYRAYRNEVLVFDVTHLFEEPLLAFDWLPDQPN